jgi:hypothetical protein
MSLRVPLPLLAATPTIGLNGGLLPGDLRNRPLVGRNQYAGMGIGFAYRF